MCFADEVFFLPQNDRISKNNDRILLVPPSVLLYHTAYHIIRDRRLTMSYQDVLAFVQENPACFIATIDGDQPRVRGFLTVLFNDGKIYFTTGTMKNVYRQLSANPNVELCYCSQDFGKMLRISGKIEIIDDGKRSGSS